MIISRLNGGLGNQLFQYACGRSLAKFNDTELSLLISGITQRYIKTNKCELRKYNIDCKLVSEMDEIMGYRFREDTSKLIDIFIRTDYDIYLNGYWQSEYYFKSVENIIIDELTLKDPIRSEPFNNMLNKILDCNSIALHVRRKDYLEPPGINEFPSYGKDYYDKAKGIIDSKVDNPHYFVFSDDIEWCKKNLVYENSTYVDLNQEGLMDLELMRKCKHFVIPNSSFGWWGAWLSRNKDKIVILPKKWTYLEEINRRIAKKWITL